MIEVKKLSCGYDSPILKDIDLTIKSGEILAVIGRNGCGKTTLLKTIAGLHPSQGGEIIIDGINLRKLSRKEIAKKTATSLQIRTTPEMFALSLVEHSRFPHLDFSRRLTDRDKKVVEDAMRQTDCIQFKNKRISKLSGGERQKVYLAFALAQDTPYLFLDEPATYLDINFQLEILDIMKKVKASGKTIVAVMHDISHAIEIADRICILNDGGIKFLGEKDNPLLGAVISEVFGVNYQLVTLENGEKHYVFSKI